MIPAEAESPTSRAEGKALVRDRGYAWTASILLHGAFILFTVFIALQSPPKQETVVELTITRDPADAPRRESATKTEKEGERRAEAPPRPRISAQVPAAAPLPDLNVELRDERENAVSFTIPQTPLERTWTPEEAYTELTRLLEEYPQFREQVLREMIAGKGFVPDTVQHIDLSLDQILADGIRPSWGRQRSAIEGAFRSYDGVSGWKQNSNYGTGVNIIGLLRFLYDLIEGE